MLLVAACGGKPATPTSAPSTALVCLAGNCATGTGASTRSAGGTRALWIGHFDDHQEAGDGTITRLAGEMLETLELDTKSATGTLRLGELSVVGQYTNLSRNAADELPELDDDGAAVMLPTGEFLFADWSPTRVVPKDGSLTEARRVIGLPDEIADLFAAAEILEDARPSGRALELHLADRALPPQKLAQLVAYAPADGVGYIVGVGVIDPEWPRARAARAAERRATARADRDRARRRSARDAPDRSRPQSRRRVADVHRRRREVAGARRRAARRVRARDGRGRARVGSRRTPRRRPRPSRR